MTRSLARRLAPAVVLLAATVGISSCSNSSDDAKTPGNTEVATGGERFGTADAETAKQILTDHIERYLGVRWFVIDHVAQYLRPQGGHVITN